VLFLFFLEKTAEKAAEFQEVFKIHKLVPLLIGDASTSSINGEPGATCELRNVHDEREGTFYAQACRCAAIRVPGTCMKDCGLCFLRSYSVCLSSRDVCWLQSRNEFH